MPIFPSFLSEKLKKRAESGKKRHLRVPKNGLIDFSSNDYLGLARNAELASTIQSEFEKMNTVSNGSTGSRLLTGNSEYALILEEKLSLFFKAEKALLFNSGYAAGSGLMSAIPQRGDTVIYDELIHACLREGIRLSLADRFSFQHNDLNELEQKLSKAKGNIYVVIESIYSMDGDTASLKEISTLCEKFGAYLIVDEAHSTGVFGEKGEGMICESEINEKVFARIYTFGKALGVHGACVAGSAQLINYLINYASSFIYTTAMPLHALVSINCAFDFVKKRGDLREKLFENIHFYQKNRPKANNSPIQTVIIPGNEEVKAKANELQEKGLNVLPVLSPTVKEGTERLRISLHAFNSEKEIKLLTNLIPT